MIFRFPDIHFTDTQWQGFKAMLSWVKDLVNIMAGIAGIIYGYRGLNAWLRQHEGKIEYDLKRRLIDVLVDMSLSAKSLMDKSFERSDGLRIASERQWDLSKVVEPQLTLKLEELVYNERSTQLRLAADELNVILREAMTIWTDFPHDETNELMSYLESLRRQVDRYYELAIEKKTGKQLTEQEISEFEKIRKYIKQDDLADFNQKMQAKFKPIVKYIKRRNSILGWRTSG